MGNRRRAVVFFFPVRSPWVSGGCLATTRHTRDAEIGRLAARRGRRRETQRRARLMLNRREFLEIGSAGALSLTVAAGGVLSGNQLRRFSRNYAPHLAMFRHHAGPDPLDEIRFLADEGFRSIEDTGLRAKSPALQRQLGGELAGRGM